MFWVDARRGRVVHLTLHVSTHVATPPETHHNRSLLFHDHIQPSLHCPRATTSAWAHHRLVGVGVCDRRPPHQMTLRRIAVRVSVVHQDGLRVRACVRVSMYACMYVCAESCVCAHNMPHTYTGLTAVNMDSSKFTLEDLGSLLRPVQHQNTKLSFLLHVGKRQHLAVTSVCVDCSKARTETSQKPPTCLGC